MIDPNTKIKIEGIPSGYTERTHSGSSAIFYPKGKWNRKEFEYTVKAPKRGMKSEMIDGEYYWVCGCPVCLGIESNINTRYHICDEHDNCVTCGKNRKELTSTPWGTVDGWRCRECQEKIDTERKIKALSAFEAEEHDEWDFCSNDKMLCPHCGSDQTNCEIYESSKEIECSVCGGCFDVEIEYYPTYSTSVHGERVTLKSIIVEKYE